MPAAFPSVELRERVGEILVKPADTEHLNQSSGKSDSTEDFPTFEGDNQSFDSRHGMSEEVQDEEDLLIAKLKSISMNQETQDLCSEDDPRDAPAEDDVPCSEKDSLEAPASIIEEVKEEKLQSPLDYPAIIEKVVDLSMHWLSFLPSLFI